MADYPTLNFPPIRLRARRGANNNTEVFDAGRGRWLVLTPEEWVRRHLVDYLITHCHAPQLSIVEEYPVNINGMPQRADIVAIGNDAKPKIVVECKEPNVRIDRAVLDQVVRYNSVLGCQYIVLTNGLSTYCYGITQEGVYEPIEAFPRNQ